MLRGYKVSRHLIDDRSERVEKIGKYVGFGTEIFSVPDPERKCTYVITSTGVLLICRGKFIITMICPKFDRMAAVYNLAGKKMSGVMIDQVFKNQRKAQKFNF